MIIQIEEKEKALLLEGMKRGMFLSEKDKENLPLFVKISVDVERKVTNDGASRRLAVALKTFRDTIMKLSTKKVLILAGWLVRHVSTE